MDFCELGLFEKVGQWMNMRYSYPYLGDEPKVVGIVDGSKEVGQSKTTNRQVKNRQRMNLRELDDG
jgi:hypothetical protein